MLIIVFKLFRAQINIVDEYGCIISKVAYFLFIVIFL